MIVSHETITFLVQVERFYNKTARHTPTPPERSKTTNVSHETIAFDVNCVISVTKQRTPPRPKSKANVSHETIDTNYRNCRKTDCFCG